MRYCPGNCQKWKPSMLLSQQAQKICNFRKMSLSQRCCRILTVLANHSYHIPLNVLDLFWIKLYTYFPNLSCYIHHRLIYRSAVFIYVIYQCQTVYLCYIPMSNCLSMLYTNVKLFIYVIYQWQTRNKSPFPANLFLDTKTLSSSTAPKDKLSQLPS